MKFLSFLTCPKRNYPATSDDSIEEPQKRLAIWQSRSELARITCTDRLAADTYHKLIVTSMLTTKVSYRRESAVPTDAGTAAAKHSINWRDSACPETSCQKRTLQW